MCGIFGIARYRGVAAPDDERVVADALGRLRARGPDDANVWSGDGVVLGVTRLAMSDPERGRQPMVSHDGDLVVAFNGELYGAAATRQLLFERGHPFRTTSDTEVLTTLLAEFGTDALATVDAQYAIAAWDRRRRVLSLARDRFGVHPLYHAPIDGGIVFGSSAALVARTSGRAAADVTALYLGLVGGGVPGARTVYAGVAQVEPGFAVHCSADGMHRVAVDPIVLPPSGEERSAIDDDELVDAFDLAVSARAVSDAPLGLLLSGGVDSGAVAASAARLGRRMPAYTLASVTGGVNEAPVASAFAAECGHVAQIVTVDGAALAERFEATVLACGEPLWRAGPVGFDVLAARVAADGIKGLLAGDGADELFCGYDVFKHTLIRRAVGRRPERARIGMFDQVDSTIGMGSGGRAPTAMLPFASEPDDVLYSHLPRWRLAASRATALLRPDLRADHTLDTYLDAVRSAHGGALDALSPLNRARHLELATMFSPFLISVQSDRPFLAHGVEGRYPFLARGVADLALSADPRRMVTARRDKIPLRRALGDAAGGPPKTAYEPGWIALRDADAFRDLCADRLSPRAIETSMFDPDRVTRLADLALRRDRARSGTFAILLQVLAIQVLFPDG